MDRLIVENVRCFHTKHSASLAPLTILVGENSSGKSTFLALLRLGWQIAAFGVAQESFDFNEEPFLLGSFEQIATFRGGRGGRARSFTIGVEVSVRTESLPPIELLGTFESLAGQPVLKSWSLKAHPFLLRLDRDHPKHSLKWTVTAPSGTLTIATDSEQPWSGVPPYNLLIAGLVTAPARLPTVKLEGEIASAEERNTLLGLTRAAFSRVGSRPFAFAPIRTRPQRTYDPINDTASPEGAHVPMILATIHSPASAEWQRLSESLGAFGTSSGLFKTVEVRRLGRQEGDPFQIRVDIEGPPVNLVDVGYGVSQVLPILVDCLRGDARSTFLLQQPEIHLHPRAQAELGSFLGLLAKAQGKRFVVETHSDYLLDRVRTDVREGRHLSPSDVSVLYFERNGREVNINQMALDTDGNLLNAPSGYRRFFLDEERRFLGLSTNVRDNRRVRR